MSELLTSLLKEAIREASSEIATGVSGKIPSTRQNSRLPVYQSRLLKEDELAEADLENFEHPEHEGACEQSPEGVKGDSDAGEYQPSLKTVSTEGTSERPSSIEKTPESILKESTRPIRKCNTPSQRYQITPGDLRKSIIAAEILGKPLSMRKKYR